MTRDSVGMDYDEDAALYPGRESKGPEPATIVQLIDKKPRQEEEDAEQVHSEIEAVARLVKSFIGTPVQEKDGMTYINPGSAALPKENNPKSYMVYDKGVFEIKTLEGEVILTHTI